MSTVRNAPNSSIPQLDGGRWELSPRAGIATFTMIAIPLYMLPPQPLAMKSTSVKRFHHENRLRVKLVVRYKVGCVMDWV